MAATPEKIKTCRTIAIIGCVIMGIGSFMSCLAATPGLIMTGNVILAVSIIISTYGFTYWRP